MFLKFFNLEIGMNLKRQIVYWLPVYIYMGGIFYFSSLSYISISVGLTSIGLSDIFQHALEYSFLGFLLARGFNNSKFKKKFLILSIVLAGFYGISDEIHQFFVPGRIFSLLDIITDFTGGILGVIIYKIIQKF